LHSHQCEIARVTDEGTEGTSAEGGTSTLKNGEVTSVVLVDLDPFSEIEVNTETKCSVNYLPRDCGIDSLIESFDSSFSVDLFGDAEGGGGAT